MSYYRPHTIITIQQFPTDAFPNRSDEFKIYFISEGDGTDSVDELGFSLDLTFPKNIYVWKGTEKVNWTKQEMVSGDNPILLRGDKISIDWRTYWIEAYMEHQVEYRIFDGYITAIDPSTPLKLKCENAAYLLKTIDVENKTWLSKDYTLESMLEEVLAGSPISLTSDGSSSNIGDITTIGANVAQLLDTLKKDYKYTSSMYGTELRCGVFRYYPISRNRHELSFQKNIAESDLEYERAEDVRIKLIAYSIEEYEITETTKAGKARKRKRRLEVELGDPDGDRRTAYFPNISSEKDLKEKGAAFYTQLKYDGFRGSFQALMMPHIKKGDIVDLIDKIIPERNGAYLVKSVAYTFGINGYRQEVEIDYKLNDENNYQ